MVTPLKILKDKYLGVTFHSKLKWNEHISKIKTKATKTLGFIKRNLKDCKPPIRSVAYQTMARPSLIYASSVWDSYYRNMID
jgi:hypothetical protein